MGGEIPAILVQVSHLLECGEDTKMIRELGLADMENIPKIDLLKEKKQWWIAYANKAAEQHSAQEEDDAGEPR